MQDLTNLVNSGIITLKPYIPGKPIETLKREYALDHIIKLASNENPLGPSPKALISLKQDMQNIHLYPDGDAFYLKSALVEYYPIERQQLTIGNGSDSLLHLIALTYVKPREKIIFSQFGFAMYKIIAQLVNAQAVEIPAKSDWSHDLQAIAAAVDTETKLIFLANPNNPTGTWFSQNELINFLDKIPKHVLVVLDEAYYEYVTEKDYPDSLKLLSSYPNLIISRTFSKIYGLAGLRVAYCIAQAELTDCLNRARLPFNVNSLAQHAATAALTDDAHRKHSLQHNLQQKDYFITQLNQLNLEFIPSIGNFITIKLGENANKFYQQLLEKGIIVRPLTNYSMPEHLRVSFGKADENQQFFKVLKQLL
ncbi:MAG: histidinol-phosphate transaminase [Pseudomonadota bacterium]